MIVRTAQTYHQIEFVSSYNLTHILSKLNSLVHFKRSVLKKINHVIIFETKDYLDPDFSEIVQRMSCQTLVQPFQL